jgi:AcrR family transcriptional regulator
VSESTLSESTQDLVGHRAVPSEPALPVPPKQARGAEKRDRLYKAAIARFETSGVRATRIEDVIGEAGVSWATFFRYFPRKEDVLVEAGARHLRGHVKKAAAEGLRDGRLRIRTVLDRTFTELLTPTELSPELHYSVLLEVVASPTRFSAMVDDGHPQPLVGLVGEILEEGRRRGEVRGDVPTAIAAMTVTAGTIFPSLSAAAIGADPRPLASEALNVLWSGVRAG